MITAVISGILTLAGVVAAAIFAMRATFRTAEAQRESDLDTAIDADRRQLREERDHLRAALEIALADRDRYRELHARMRLDIIGQGWDPDNLDGKGHR